MPPAYASPAAGIVPLGSVNEPSMSNTITTGSLLLFRVKVNWMLSGPVAVAVSAAGASGVRGVNFSVRLPSSMLNVPPPRSWSKLLASTAKLPASNPLTVPFTMVHS